MAKLSGLKRIVVEDFKGEDQAMISKLAFIINPMIDNILQVLNKNLSINDNFNQTLTDLSLKVDSSGVPTVESVIKYDLKTPCKGIQVINVKNLSNSALYPTAAPIVSFEQVSSTLIRIKHITGLVANNSYTLTLIIYAA